MGKCLKSQSNVSCNWLPFPTAYFAKLKIKLVHLLTLSRRRPLSYRNQSIGLLSSLRHKRVKNKTTEIGMGTRKLVIGTRKIYFFGFYR